MATHKAKSRVCLTADDQLCAESDPKAATLFAPVDAERSTAELEKYPNAADFFTGFEHKSKKDDVRIEAQEESEEPHKKHGKAAKVEKHKE